MVGWMPGERTTRARLSATSNRDGGRAAPSPGDRDALHIQRELDHIVLEYHLADVKPVDPGREIHADRPNDRRLDVLQRVVAADGGDPAGLQLNGGSEIAPLDQGTRLTLRLPPRLPGAHPYYVYGIPL